VVLTIAGDVTFDDVMASSGTEGVLKPG